MLKMGKTRKKFVRRTIRLCLYRRLTEMCISVASVMNSDERNKCRNE